MNILVEQGYVCTHVGVNMGVCVCVICICVCAGVIRMYVLFVGVSEFLRVCV